tara:strand:+ start:411 stop:1991 length:1581 start_codon:yes stop_codon:yes gene_type:complete
VEEFDYAWGEVEKGIRDSFRQGRTNRRNNRASQAGDERQRRIDARPQSVSSPPGGPTGGPPSIGPRTPSVLSAPPAPEPAPVQEMPDPLRPISDLNAQINPVPRESAKHDYLEEGFPPRQRPELGEASQAASPIDSTGIGQGGFEGDRLDPNEKIREEKGQNWKDSLTDSVNAGRATTQEAHDSYGGEFSPESGYKEHLEETYPNAPPPQEPKDLQEANERVLPTIGNAIGDVTEAIDISDGVDNEPDRMSLEEANHALASQGAWDEVAPPAPAPEPEPRETFLEYPEPMPLYEERIETPASEEPKIEEAVTSEPEPVPKAEPKPEPKKTKTQKKTTIKPDKKVDKKAKEAHAKEVRSKMAPNAPIPEDPKAKAEPAPAPAPAPEPPNPTDKLPKAPKNAEKTAADIDSKNKTGIYDSAEGEDPKAKRVQVGDTFMSPIAASSAVRAGTHQWGSKRDGRASLIPVKGAKTKEATHKPDEKVSAVASKKVNEPAGTAKEDVKNVMGKKQPNNPIPKAKPKPQKSKKN